MVILAPPKVGDVFAGKYRVERILGRGGMGTVMLATQLQIDEPVALKLLHPWLAEDPELVVRFEREAKAARKIRSEHVVRILDIGTLDGGAPYMVMEYLDGTDLDALLQKSGPQGVMTTVDTILQAMEALAEAHVQGMVHRDLKPANLFLAKRADGTPLVKVLDFGISKVVSDKDPGGLALTKTNAGGMGSPVYMAPEQMRSARSVDARTDVWALGIIFYELLSGKTPFDASSMTELTAMILQDDPPPLRQRRPDVPPALEAVILRALQKKPEARYPDVASFARELEPFASVAGKLSVERIVGVYRTSSGTGTAPMEKPLVSTKPPPLVSTPPPTVFAPSMPPPQPQRPNVTTVPRMGPPPPAPVRSSWNLGAGVAVVLALVGGLMLLALYGTVHNVIVPPDAAAARPVEPPTVGTATSAEPSGPYVPRVLAVPMTGTYPMPFYANLIIRASNAEVHYTLDGSPPTRNSPRYEGGIPIASEVTLEAVAFYPDRPPSPVTEARYQLVKDADLLPLGASSPVTEANCGETVGDFYLPINGSSSTLVPIAVEMASGAKSPFEVSIDDTTTSIMKPAKLNIHLKPIPKTIESAYGFEDNVVITYGDHHVRHLTLHSHGRGTGLDVDGKPIDFGTQRIGTVSQELQIPVGYVNNSQGRGHIEAALDDPTSFKVSTPRFEIGNSGELKVLVTYQPEKVGTHATNLRISVTGLSCSVPVVIPIHGTGTGSGEGEAPGWAPPKPKPPHNPRDIRKTGDPLDPWER